jgi:glucose-1-phosphate thymidylyltransferase
MRRSDGRTSLTPEQERAANSGSKAMMPVGRPFLDYVLSALADGGITDVCIVVSPDDAVIRNRYGRALDLTRLRIEFAEQASPRGTADALLAARTFAGDDIFVVLNADNYYSADAIRSLCRAAVPALAGYNTDQLVTGGNIPRERIRLFALVRADANGDLDEIVEKPTAVEASTMGANARVSMNLWAFGPEIFDACAQVRPSPRGEFELADAVRIAKREMGVRFRIVPVPGGVLDLSGRGDVASVAERFAGVTVQL